MRGPASSTLVRSLTDYNYVHFPADMQDADFEAFRHGLHAGDRAPDGELIHAADGATVRLSDYWHRGPLVVEFGSIT